MNREFAEEYAGEDGAQDLGAAHASEPEPGDVPMDMSVEREKEERMIQPVGAAEVERERAVKILAKSLYRELTNSGYEGRQIVALSTELLGLVTTALHQKDS